MVENGSLTLEDKLKLESWGLPSYILQKYLKKGISSMFPWQLECLTSGDVLQGGNLVYSAPTSAGKTLVAEILALQTVLERKKKVIMILPFVSVVREKMLYFQDIFSGSGVRVEGFMGSYHPPGGFRAVHMAICTIEKANNLINRLLEEREFDDLGCVIVDELHLVGDPHRGYLLELLITKIKYICDNKLAPSIQIVGMSATLPNLDLLAKWLNATLYRTDFRPVPLVEHLKVNNKIYEAPEFNSSHDMNLKFSIDNDPGDVIYLCIDTILNGFSVVVFCPTKAWCETLAQQISGQIKKLGNISGDVGVALRQQLDSNAISDILNQLRKTQVGLDPCLGKSVAFAVGFHHAGLTMDERDIIEGGFRSNVIRVLVATSTLSSGVNLPARRVIIRTPCANGRMMDILSYKQMVGRAGRMGKDCLGESFLICSEENKNQGKQLVTLSLPPISSCLGGVNLTSSLKRAILEVIASRAACCLSDVELYAKCTLLAASLDQASISSAVESCVAYLQSKEFIVVGVDAIINASALAEACLSASLPPEQALSLLAELDKSRKCFVLETDLHAIYQVTPLSVANQWTIDWMKFLAIWEELSQSVQKIGRLVGVDETFIIKSMRGAVNYGLDKISEKIAVHKRFYAALALQDLVNEVPLIEVADKYGCNKGVLQSLQQSTSTFCGMVTSFCRKLKWGPLEVVIAQLGQRLHFGAQRDLLDLLQLECMTATMARILYSSGITSLSELAGSSLKDVQSAIHKGTPFIRQEDPIDERIKRDVYLPGRPGLTEPEAADLLIHEARIFLVRRLGLKDAVWGNDTRLIHDQTTVMPSQNESRKSCIGVIEVKRNDSNNASKILERRDSEAMVILTPDDTASRRSFARLLNVSNHRIAKTTMCYDSSGSESIIASESPQITTSNKPESSNYLRLSLRLGDNDLDLSGGKFKDGKSSTPCDSHRSPAIIDRNKSRLSLESNASETDMFADTSQNLSSSLVCAAESDQPLEVLDPNWGGDSLLIASQLIDDYKTSGTGERFGAKRKLLDNEHSHTFKKIKSSETCKTETPNGGNGSHAFSDSLVLSTQLEQLLNTENDKPSPKIHINSEVEQHKISMTDSFLIAALEESFELENVMGVKQSAAPHPSEPACDTPKKSATRVSPQTISAVDSPARNASFLNTSSFGKVSPMSTPKKLHRTKPRTYHRNSPVSSKYSPVVMVVKKGDDSRWNRSKSFSSSTVAGHSKEQPKSFKRFKSTDWITDKDKIDDHSSDEELLAQHLQPDPVSTAPKPSSPPLSAQLSHNPHDGIDSRKLKHICHDIREVKLFLTAVLREKNLVLDVDWGQGGSANNKIGAKICNNSPAQESKSELTNGDLILLGIYWKVGNDVYYTCTKKSDCICIGSVKLILQMRDIVLWGYDIKTLMKKLYRCSGILIQCKVKDVCVADWLISSSEHRKSLRDLVKEHAQSQELETFNSLTDEKLRAIFSINILKETLERILEQSQLLDCFNDVEMPIHALLAYVELNGMKLDREICSELWTLAEQQMKELEETAYRTVGRKFSLSSYNDVKKVRESLELKPGSNKEHPIDRVISNWRKLSSLKSRNISQLLSSHIVNGRCEGVSNTYTATGRIVMFEPSIQHTPRDFVVDGNLFSLRSSFTASEGNVLVSADFSQLELRILAHFSEDSSLISAILGESDIFVSIASKWNSISHEQVTDEIRQQTKQIIYGIIYGMGDRRLGEALGLSASDATMMTAKFRRSYPGVQRFLESCVDQCKSKGYIVTLKGRRRQLPGIYSSVKSVKSQAERQAVNSTIQGSAADIAKAAAVNIEHRLNHCLSKRSPLISSGCASHLVLHLHDELIYEVSHDHLAVVCDIIRREMNSVVELLVPLPVVIKAGPSWGKLKRVD